jgi:hypothetical protein
MCVFFLIFCIALTDTGFVKSNGYIRMLKFVISIMFAFDKHLYYLCI